MNESISNPPTYQVRTDGPIIEVTGNLIFVVDDDRGFLKSTSRLLKAHGFDVRAFLSAEDFQGRADVREPGCLILDVNLGGISGIELLRQLLQSGSTIPVILVTANDSEIHRRAALAAGCVAYLEKPFALDALTDALGRALRPKRHSFD